MRKISLSQVLLIHGRLIIDSGGTDGLRDVGLLESAMAAPYQEFAGVSNYPSCEEKAARLGFGIINNHPFLDGNKRTGAHIMLLLLQINGIFLEYTQKELIEIILSAADGKADYHSLLTWITEHKI